ncbi:MAG: helix-turn-helix domain-containing protein [Actinomycetota bacterium]|nr:helix-turn-helix domain-containing protein [Actinomycetota bacterium]
MNDRVTNDPTRTLDPVPARSGPERTGDLEVGRRIAHHRRRRGLSQPVFAQMVSRSTAWVSGVERGKYHLDRLSLLIKLAAALDVTVGDLLPDVVRWGADEPHVSDDSTGLVALLGTYPVIGALYGNPPGPVDLDDLEARIDALAALGQGADHAAVAAALAQILPLADAATLIDAPVVRHPRSEFESRPYALWSRAYGIAAPVLFYLGQSAASWVAVDRAIRGASRGGDPTLMVSAVLRAARLFLIDGRLDQAHAAGESVVDGLAAVVTDPAAPVAELALAGAAHLVLAAVAANRWNRGTADHHLAAAAALAERVGPDQRFYDTEFGPDEVAVHRVIVAVGLEDAGDAITLAREVDTRPLTPERHARLLLHWARAEILRRAPDRAVALLMRADRLNPEQTAQHPMSWSAIEDLRAMAVRIHATGDLARLQSKVRRPR